MKVLSQYSSITSIVLVFAIFNSVNAVRTFSIKLSPEVVNTICHAHVEAQVAEPKQVNVVQLLLEFYRENSKVFDDVLNVFEFDEKNATIVIPDNVISQIPDEYRNIICFHLDSKYTIRIAIFHVLNSINDLVKDGIDETKGAACCACTDPFKGKKSENFLMTAGLVAYILTKISEESKKIDATKISTSGPISISIPVKLLKFE